jgi:hypothetical protein
MNVSTHVSLSSQILWIVSGIAGGVVVGVALTQRQLNSLAGKGETGRTVSVIPILLFILGGCFVLAALFLVALPITVLLTVMYGVFNFVFCAGIAFILARDFLLLEWERNHKMRLYQKGSRFYVVPKPDSHDNQYHNRSG